MDVDAEAERLRLAWPGWDIWTVWQWNGMRSSTVWCARVKGDDLPSVYADSPGELCDRLRAAEDVALQIAAPRRGESPDAAPNPNLNEQERAR